MRCNELSKLQHASPNYDSSDKELDSKVVVVVLSHIVKSSKGVDS